MHLEIMGTIYIMYERKIFSKFTDLIYRLQHAGRCNCKQFYSIHENLYIILNIDANGNGWRNCLELTYDRIMVADQTLKENWQEKW